MSGFKVTLTAFVQFFFGVHFQINPQFVELLRFFRFHMRSENVGMKKFSM